MQNLVHLHFLLKTDQLAELSVRAATEYEARPRPVYPEKPASVADPAIIYLNLGTLKTSVLHFGPESRMARGHSLIGCRRHKQQSAVVWAIRC